MSEVSASQPCEVRILGKGKVLPLFKVDFSFQMLSTDFETIVNSLKKSQANLLEVRTLLYDLQTALYTAGTNLRMLVGFLTDF